MPGQVRGCGVLLTTLAARVPCFLFVSDVCDRLGSAVRLKELLVGVMRGARLSLDLNRLRLHGRPGLLAPVVTDD